jgi:hypothetical protein
MVMAQKTPFSLRRWPAGFRMASVLLIMVLAVWPAWLTSARAADTVSVAAPVDPFADVIPQALAATERTAADLSAVRMDVALDPDASSIGGTMSVTWHNAAAEPLDEVWFRLFPNADYYGEGNLAVSDLTVDGTAVKPELSLGDTALRVPLPQPVAPGHSAEIALTFTSTVPADSTGSFGIFNHDTKHGSWVLADWYPVLAVYEEGNGWALPPVTSFGDPTYSPSALYDVQIAAPADLEVAATGVVTDETTEGATVSRRYVAGPARDFAIVADDDDQTTSKDAGETQVTLWTAPNLNATTRDKTLGIAADALRFYDGLWGPYPSRDVDLVEVDPNGALGIAWTGLLFLDGPALLETSGEHDSNGLATIVAHETSHLWWGILVGGDSNAHGYIQEGLATTSSLLFDEEAFGPDVAASELDTWVIAPAQRLLNAGDAVVDVPISADENESIRSDATYGKGTLGFLAIRQEIGKEAFNAALHDVASRYAWREMTPAQLRAAFERASGEDLSALWSHWFDEAAMTKAEIDGLAKTFG